MESCAAVVSDAAVQRRMIFATHYLPHDLPNYWDIIARFSNQVNLEQSGISPESAKMTMENIHILSPQAFISDMELTKELIEMECNVTKQSLGIPLVPNQTNCISCGGNLLLRSDRPSRISLYTESLGTVPGTHYHKYCQNYRKGCRLVQYYGYHKTGSENAEYSANWDTLPYFISTQETGFEIKFLKQFDVELLIGQVSYKQKADIYNIAKGYDTTKKFSSVTETEKSTHKTPVHGYNSLLA